MKRNQVKEAKFSQSNNLEKAVPYIIEWYQNNKRDLPWRNGANAYHIWVSEIMLQQTRVEAVKSYYAAFLEAFPTIEALANAPEERLLKLWEGLGYYNRVRNMQKAAVQIVELYNGQMPQDYEQIKGLSGIGNYTAGAISSFAFGIPKPAVDGNVLRVISRFHASYEDIMKASTRKHIEEEIEGVIPENAASDFNQGLIELGAIVCVPNGEPKCNICPIAKLCKANQMSVQMELPVKKKAKDRRIEKRTILIIKDEEKIAIQKRPEKGLLAGLYEFPNLEGHLTRKQLIEYAKSIGMMPVRIKKLENAKHIFSHVEWHMTGYEIIVDELEKTCRTDMIFADKKEVMGKYPIPTAFSAYTQYALSIMEN